MRVHFGYSIVLLLTLLHRANLYTFRQSLIKNCKIKRYFFCVRNLKILSLFGAVVNLTKIVKLKDNLIVLCVRREADSFVFSRRRREYDLAGVALVIVGLFVCLLPLQ